MSDDLTGKLFAEMLDSNKQWRELYRNQQELIAGLNALLHSHTNALRVHQRAIEILCKECGIAFVPDDSSAPPSDQPN
jgi:hypothetical protein